MYYECNQCGEMTTAVDEESFVMTCPICEEPTLWTYAFEGEGVSF